MALLRLAAPLFFRSAPPTQREEWRMQAERRAVMAAAAALRLPVDSPPELVEACARDEEGNLKASEVCRAATDAAMAEWSARTP